jgi:hypothetical protein
MVPVGTELAEEKQSAANTRVGNQIYQAVASPVAATPTRRENHQKVDARGPVNRNRAAKPTNSNQQAVTHVPVIAPDRERELRQAISLQQQRNKNEEKIQQKNQQAKRDKRIRDKERNANKDATPEHVNQLRDALQSVLSQVKESAEQADKKEETPLVKESAPTKPVEPAPKTEPQPNLRDEIAPHEIPRDVLEKLLEVE